MLLPSIAQIDEARKTIAGSAIRTPLVRLNVDDAPAEIYLKLENLQPIGSFKIRGAANAMGHMPHELLSRGVLTASAGNMAQGVAWRARELGIPCTVVAPETAPDTKVRAVERLGGRVIKVPFEDWWRAFEERAFPGVEATFIHAFDDLNVMAGNGTIALEIMEELAEFDAIVIPWGGGGLTCGIASALRTLNSQCKIYAAEVATAAPLAASLSAGSPASVALSTIICRRHQRQARLSPDVRPSPRSNRRLPCRRAGRSRLRPPPHGRAQSHHRRRRRRLPRRLRPVRQSRWRQSRLHCLRRKYRRVHSLRDTYKLAFWIGFLWCALLFSEVHNLVIPEYINGSSRLQPKL